MLWSIIDGIKAILQHYFGNIKINAIADDSPRIVFAAFSTRYLHRPPAMSLRCYFVLTMRRPLVMKPILAAS